jgi:hypothetical protein
MFVGNIGIKPATTPLIRRFGFKPVLVFASLASAGIAIGALLIRVYEAGGLLLGGAEAAGADPVAPYRAAFLALAVVMLLSTLDSLTLPRHAGAEVSRPGPAPAAAPRRHRRA